MTEAPLNNFNFEVMSCFKDFIKYNTYLVHLDLTMTGLIVPAIKYVSALLRRSQALSCLHLCGNKGLTDEIFEWIKTRIRAKECHPPLIVPPSKAQYDLNLEEK